MTRLRSALLGGAMFTIAFASVRPVRGEGTCAESVPEEAVRPVLHETFPTKGTSGYAAWLEVVIEHGKGESVLPRGVEVQAASEAAKAFREAGFFFPSGEDGGVGPTVTSLADPGKEGQTKTRLAIPFALLPSKPGRQTLTLPSVPVAVARASGQLMTLCTSPHVIVVEDPTADVPEAMPKPNAPPLAQREEWTALKRATLWGSLGVMLGALLAYLGYKWMNRPKPVPPPPPPRPPWEVALESLRLLQGARLLEAGRSGEFIERVSNTVRVYLGARYGFDGLESTSDEVLTRLKGVPHFGLPIAEVRIFLETADLVKFAKMSPSYEECVQLFGDGERIVHVTMPQRPSVRPHGPPSSRNPGRPR